MNTTAAAPLPSTAPPPANSRNCTVNTTEPPVPTPLSMTVAGVDPPTADVGTARRRGRTLRCTQTHFKEPTKSPVMTARRCPVDKRRDGCGNRHPHSALRQLDVLMGEWDMWAAGHSAGPAACG
ncbi:hypothetical protein GCM10022206_65770 [Streptomyces chiangmaiensis]